MGNPHHDRATSSSTPFFSQHQQTNLPAAQAAVAASQASATHSTPYDPGHQSAADNPRYNTPVATTPNINLTTHNPDGTPKMQTGFGSWFGANTGSTASSQLVQKTIQNQIDKAIAAQYELHRTGKVKDKWGNVIPWQASTKNKVIGDVMENLYPSLPSMSKEDFLSQGGEEWEYDYITENFSGYKGGTGNLMNMGSGVPLPGHVGIDMLNWDYGDGGYGGGGGGGDYWDYYSGGGGGGGGGYGGGELPPKPMFQRQPGDRFGQQDPWLQAMINTHGGQGFQQGFRRGGIVSLVT